MFCERKNSPASLAIVLFLTEEHRRTEHTAFHRDIKSTDITKPYSHLWQLRSVNSVCRRRSVRSILCAKGSVKSVRSVREKTPHKLSSALKCSVKSVNSVRDKTPQRVSQLFFFSQRNTDEQNTQHSTETLSQPISQNLTAIFGSYAL